MLGKSLAPAGKAPSTHTLLSGLPSQPWQPNREWETLTGTLARKALLLISFNIDKICCRDVVKKNANISYRRQRWGVDVPVNIPKREHGSRAQRSELSSAFNQHACDIGQRQGQRRNCFQYSKSPVLLISEYHRERHSSAHPRRSPHPRVFP